MKILIAALLCTIALATRAQADLDPRLFAKYDQARWAELLEHHPAVVDYWTFYLDGAYTLEDAPAGKDLSNLPEVEVADLNDLNILALDVHPIGTGRKIYRIQGTDKLIVMRSTEDITARFNEYRKNR